MSTEEPREQAKRLSRRKFLGSVAVAGAGAYGASLLARRAGGAGGQCGAHVGQVGRRRSGGLRRRRFRRGHRSDQGRSLGHSAREDHRRRRRHQDCRAALCIWAAAPSPGRRRSASRTPGTTCTSISSRHWATAQITDHIALFCDKSLELYDWITGLGGMSCPEAGHGPPGGWPRPASGLIYSGNERGAEYAAVAEAAPRGHSPGGTGADIFAPLETAVGKSGAQVLYQAEAQSLVQKTPRDESSVYRPRSAARAWPSRPSAAWCSPPAPTPLTRTWSRQPARQAS